MRRLLLLGFLLAGLVFAMPATATADNSRQGVYNQGVDITVYTHLEFTSATTAEGEFVVYAFGEVVDYGWTYAELHGRRVYQSFYGQDGVTYVYYGGALDYTSDTTAELNGRFVILPETVGERGSGEVHEYVDFAAGEVWQTFTGTVYFS